MNQDAKVVTAVDSLLLIEQDIEETERQINALTTHMEKRCNQLVNARSEVARVLKVTGNRQGVVYKGRKYELVEHDDILDVAIEPFVAKILHAVVS